MKTPDLISSLLISTFLTTMGCATLKNPQRVVTEENEQWSKPDTSKINFYGNTSLGAIINSSVGGATGSIINSKMDNQALEIKKAIPSSSVQRIGEGIIIEFRSNILFAFDKATFSEETKNNFSKLIVVLNEYPDTYIELHGHTDNKGSEAYNLTLSEKRVKAVSSYLTENGFDSSRIITRAFGEYAPKYTNKTIEGRIQNRRIELLIIADKKMKNDSQIEANK